MVLVTEDVLMPELETEGEDSAGTAIGLTALGLVLELSAGRG